MYTEIIFILIGIVLLIASFLIPERLSASNKLTAIDINSEDLRSILTQELKSSNIQMEDILADVTEHAEREAKRTLEYLTNEKIMAINEYSDQVMDDIHKNHGDVMFLYGMLKDKEDEIRQLLEQAAQLKRQQPKAYDDTAYGKDAEKAKSVFQTSKQEKMETKKSFNSGKTVTESLEGRESLEFVEQQEIAFAISGNQDREKAGMKKSRSKERAEELSDLDSELVLRLYAEGKDVKEIAKQLKVGVGEVKLVVGINRSGRS